MNAVQYVFSVVKSCTHDYTCDNEWKRGTVTSRLRKTERVGINFAFFKERRMFLTIHVISKKTVKYVIFYLRAPLASRRARR